MGNIEVEPTKNMIEVESTRNSVDVAAVPIETLMSLLTPFHVVTEKREVE